MTQVGWEGVDQNQDAALALAGAPAASLVPKCPQGPTEAAGTGASEVLWKSEHSLLRSPLWDGNFKEVEKTPMGRNICAKESVASGGRLRRGPGECSVSCTTRRVRGVLGVQNISP